MAQPVAGKVEEKASLKVEPAASEEVGGRYRLWSVYRALAGRWAELRLESRFSLVTAAVVGLAMVLLGHWIELSVRAGWQKSMADVSATFVEAIVLPHLGDLEAGKPLSTQAEAELVELIAGTALGAKVKTIKIWGTEGSLLFSTDGLRGEHHLRPQQLARLLSGEVVSVAGNHAASSPGSSQMVEVYAPVYSRSEPKRIVAIAEFYNTNDLLNREVEQLKYALWFLIFNVSFVVGIMLYALIRRAGATIARQQGLLAKNVARASALANRNRSLRLAADRARVRAAVTIEEYLSRIGADLHDGPIQMLSLMMLRLPPPSHDPAIDDLRVQLHPLIEQTLGELRNLSAGLVLPDIRDLSPVATIEAAVSYHERNTGTKVSRHFGEVPVEVPEAIRICAFRVIQEGLMNAYKHADGRGQRVEAGFDDGHLILSIEDAGHSHPAIAVGPGLGLRGMRTRVNALRGVLSISRLPSGGMALSVRLPVRVRSLTAPIVSEDSRDRQA